MSSDSDTTCSIRHNPYKRKKIVISDSSDESVIIRTRRKKKTLRVVSEGESSSDESDVPKPVIRRQNHRVISEEESSYNSSADESKSTQNDSSSTTEWQSDWSSSDDEDDKKYNAKRKVLTKTKNENANKPSSSSSINANANSESSDDQAEKCPICLLPFRRQQIGNPSACDHCFCLECLLEWSKNINTCPVDRIHFNTIVVKDHFDGKIINHLPVEAVPRIENQVLDDPTFCEICHQSDREDRMLLCDNCDRGYHMECLTPPMTTVPIEEWYCPDCTTSNSTRLYLSSFVPTLITTGRPSSSRFLREIRRSLNIFRNMIPSIDDRTYVSRDRRVRNRDRDRARDVVEHFIDPNQPSTSSGIDGDNSRSRSPTIGRVNLESKASSMRSKTKSKNKTTRRKKKKLTKSTERIGDLVREVRIKEYNNDGEEEEIVKYVKVASSTSRRKCKKRTKKTRKV